MPQDSIMRRTRVVATIGPSSWDIDNLRSVFNAGADVFRLNYSHGEPEDKTELYEKIRSLETEERTTCILADLPGPKLRLGEFTGVKLLTNGETVRLLCGKKRHEGEELPVEYDGLSAELKKGDSILLADGLVRLSVINTGGEKSSFIDCIVEDGGPLTSRKGVNVPGTTIDLPAIGAKDKLALDHAIKSGADWIAVSYVRSAEDIRPARDAIKAAGVHTPIIAKIEHPAALKNLQSILNAADGVMVARGDLGVEIPLEQVPLAQQNIIDAGLMRGMVVIVATQMLESMTLNPRPTRAEVTDVANAIYEGADAVMLSGETTIGKYPVECVSFISRIASQTEKYKTLGYESKLISDTDWQHLGIAAKNIAESISADGIIAITRSGQTAEIVSNAKPFMIPIFAFSNNRKTLNQLALAGSVNAFYSPMYVDHEKNVNSAMKAIKKVLKPKKDLKFVVISGILSETSADAIEIRYLKLD